MADPAPDPVADARARSAALLAAFQADLTAATDLGALDVVRRAHAGKSSPVKALLKALRDVPADLRPGVAAGINQVADRIEEELAAKAKDLEAVALDARLDAEWQDTTLPGVGPTRGARHPLTDVERQCADVLRRLGFEMVEGPEVEHPFYNFDALNIPEHHPARDMQDTFWVTGGYLLRSHTTTVQARILEKAAGKPVKIASAGRTYRNEAVDATHLAMFHQLEGIWVDRGLTFAHLKGVLAFVARELFGEQRIRFKPKFYPYTEPSAGVDLACSMCDGAGCDACHGAGWVTILGSGMIHPKVLRTFGYDPDEYSGIAFGFGTTRMAAQRAGVVKVRSMYEQDVRVIRALHRGTP